MKYEFVRLNYKNNPAKSAEIENHQSIIREYAEKGYRYGGYIPVKSGPSGKILAVDLIFEIDE